MSKILYGVNSLKTFLKREKYSSIHIISSKKLIQKLGWFVEKVGLSKKNIIFLPDGELAKELDETEKLVRKFIDLNIDRKGIVLALGGGSIGDAVGFACAIYLRGIRYIQVPTTLLSQVDSAHGGKTGINFLKYKNQLGSFYSPRAIVLDARFIRPLPKEQIIDGLGEIIKAGLIKDPSILDLLKKENITTLSNSISLKKIIERTIKVKNYHTKKDPYDSGPRQILNFGHTVGHAIELKYKISHGRAVLSGMLQELKIAEALGVTQPSVRKKLEQLLKNLGIKIKEMKPSIKTILQDKKISGDTIILPIIKKEGVAKLMALSIKKLNSFLVFQK